MYTSIGLNVIQDYYRQNPPSNLQTASYDTLVNDLLPSIIHDSSIRIDIDCHQELLIVFKNVYVDKAYVYDEHRNKRYILPDEARIRDLTYETTVCVDVECITTCNKTSKSQYYPKVNLFSIPVMLHSSLCHLRYTPVSETKECEYDMGGYFVIKGKERVIVAQERINYDKVYVFQKNASKYKLSGELRSIKEDADYSVLVQIHLSNDNLLFTSVPYISSDIPLQILFIALGIDCDDIIRMYDYSEYSQGVVARSLTQYDDMDRTDALEYISHFIQYNISINDTAKKILYTEQILYQEIVPHLGLVSTPSERAMFLNIIIKKVLDTSNGLRECDDRDHICNKRVEMVGDLMGNLIKSLFKRSLKSIQQYIEKRAEYNIITLLNRFNITSKIYHCFSTGNWGVPKSTYIRQGVSQILSRLSYIGTMSHLRRVMVPIGKESKNTKVRQINATSFGYIDPIECFDPATPILLWNGSIKLAGDIAVGDQLIGDDGLPTTVRKTCSGEYMMYEVRPKKKNFMNYTVTANHIMVFKIKMHKRIHKQKQRSGYNVYSFDKINMKCNERFFASIEDAIEYQQSIKEDDILEITVEKYLTLSPYIKSMLYEHKISGIHWEKQDVLLDPYLLGMWLGDGLSSGFGFATNDIECLEYWENWASQHNCQVKHHTRYQYGISKHKPRIDKFTGSTFRHNLKHYNLIQNKHIPMEYIRNDRDTRLKLLAGLVDTDGSVRANGHEIRITQGPKNTRIIDDALFLARSLGFSCNINTGKSQWTHKFPDGTTEKRFSTYTELSMTGEFLYELPTRVPHKKLNKFDCEKSRYKCASYLQSPVQIIQKGIGPFAGWQLDGNERFLLSDCTILHNTPEGASCGIVKSFSLLVKVSDNIHTVIIQDIILKFLGSFLLPLDLSMYNLFINGVWIGSLANKNDALDMLKNLRKLNIIPFSASISYDTVDREINIASDSGRILRAVIQDIEGLLEVIDTLQNNNNNLYQYLVDRNIIVFIDGSEAESSYICMDLTNHLNGSFIGCNANNVPYDYYEIHPSILLGICSATIPFTDHSQSPRNVYGSAMTKQSIGIFATSFLNRFDTFSHVLYYPQKRLVTTSLSKFINYEEIPSGINCIIAIACYTGQNVEDSVILNRGAIDRGMFRNVSYKSFSVSETRGGTYESQVIEIPPLEFQNKSIYNYSKLDADGIIKVNSVIELNDVLVGKVLRENDEVTKDTSKICSHNDQGIIDKVCVTINSTGYKHVKIRIRRERIPEVGDKLCHITAQKGVCLLSNTLVTTQAGTSKMIKDVNIGDKLWGYSESENGLQTSMCTNKAYMGRKETLKITMGNGTVIECTPDHRVYTKSGWVEAGDLSPSDYIASNLPAPLDIHYPEENTWDLHMHYSNTKGEYKLNLHMRDEYNRTKSLAFARILGYILSDGWLCKYNERNNKYRCGAAFGTILDCNLFIDDLKLLIDNIIINGKQIEPRFYDSKSYTGACYVYDLPDYMTNFLASLEGIPIGKRIESKQSMPMFLHTAPLSIIREFLGGLFGGDGCAPYICRELHSSNIMWKCKEEHKEDSLVYMNTIKDMLDRLGVVSSVSSPKYRASKAKDKQQRMVIGVNIRKTSDFLTKIGFRYCMNKQTKLSAASTYWQMRSHNNDTIEGLGGGQRWGSAIDWLEKITATPLFEKGTHCIGRTTSSVPYYYLPISKIEDNGIQDVYDITVDTLESFIANGLIVHNCGAIYSQEDMPFTAQGIVPDVIMNPHCITSRMTINTLLETISGKAGCFSGRIQDSTTFEHDGNDIITDMGAELVKNGFESMGYETLYNGFTGEPMKAQIYMGCGYYHRLKHLVSDKVHARARGDVQQLSRQPLSGRSKQGGLRLGEINFLSLWFVKLLQVCV